MNEIQVAHAINPNFGVGPDTPQYPDGYKTVAIVKLPNKIQPENYLDDVYRLTNHIDWEWWGNPDVTLVGKPTHRSTSMGDILVLPDDRKFRCEMIGWKEIG